MPLTEAKKRNNAAWDAKNLKRMSLAVPIQLYERMQARIEATGQTMNGFIKQAIERELYTHPEGDYGTPNQPE